MSDYTMQASTQAPLEVGRITAPKQYAERVILVLDGSGSMTDPAVGKISKADAVTGRNLARLSGNRRRLVDSYIPLPRLFFNRRSFLVRRWRIEDLAYSAFGHGSGRRV